MIQDNLKLSNGQTNFLNQAEMLAGLTAPLRESGSQTERDLLTGAGVLLVSSASLMVHSSPRLIGPPGRVTSVGRLVIAAVAV